MRRRILLLVSGVTLLVVLAFAIPLAILIRNAVAQRAERATVDEANGIALFLRDGVPSTDAITSYLRSLPSGRSASVVLPNGTVLGTAPPGDALTQRPPDFPRGGDDEHGGRAPAPDVALQSIPGGKIATTAVSSRDGPYLVRVFVSNDALRSGVTRWWLLLGAGSLLLLVIGVAGGELVTRRIVAPLTRTAETAHRVSAGDLTARAPTTGPREVAAVGSALNRLADRIDELIAEERETVADMSHRMRTPLTALRLDAESLRDPVEAERIGAHVSALERTLTAVIRAARRQQREGRLPSTDATAVVHDRVTFWSALTDEQDRTHTVALPDGPLLVRASEEDLSAALDALLENIVAHTPDATGFTVQLAASEGGAVLAVGDEGAGVPDGAGVRGRSDRGSSGLGLSIARQVAEASGGTMTIGRSEQGGALISLRFGAP